MALLDDAGGDPERCPDWEALRKLSLQPGGFRDKRIHVWPELLHVAVSPSETEALSEKDTPTTTAKLPDEAHGDERQIQLDTERSFVLYTVDDAIHSRETLQSQLHELLLAIFRRHPKLSYFQGFHDIITVLFMTLPPELQLISAEKLSLQRLRDAMGSTLEPVLGLLRVLKNLLKLADPTYSTLLAHTSPLPYYALSNLLTLFSHDMPTLPLIQHVFDYLLCRPPISVVYLAAALILSRRQEVERLEQEGEDGMVHSLLSGMPDISDEVPDEEQCAPTGALGQAPANHQLNVHSGQDTYEPLDGDGDKREMGSQDLLEGETQATDVGPTDCHLETHTTKSHDEHDTSDTPLDTPLSGESGTIFHESESGGIAETDIPPYISPPPPFRPRRAKVTLTSLLTHADELYSSFPPTHPGIDLSSIMGPQSVVFTWSEHHSKIPGDDEAEAMVERVDLIVKPYVDLNEDKESTHGSKEDVRRRQRKLRRSAAFTVERRMVVAGAVLALGVGIAVYMNTKSPGLFSGLGSRYNDRAWRLAGAWAGGVLAAGGEHVILR